MGLPLALARAAAPLALGLMWTAQSGYTYGLWMLLVFSLVGVGALMLAQPSVIKRPVVEWPGQVSVGFDAATWAALAP